MLQFRNILNKVFTAFAFAAILASCKVDPAIEDPDAVKPEFKGTPYPLEIPAGFTTMPIPADNPLTVEGVKLGRLLFYDPILSGDSTQSCGSCHASQFAFSDNGKRFSTGILGIEGNMNGMPLVNLAWVRTGLFWDGRSKTLEEQALEPVMNRIEMHEDWPTAVKKLKRHPEYPQLFYDAFGTRNITPELAAKALAQFERIMISGNSRYDRRFSGERMTESERNGMILFFSEKADCFHCHGDPRFFTDNEFRNNGLDAASTYNEIPHKGRGIITGKKEDFGKFRTPTLRNVEFTAPYMHDGRFATLEEVMEHYASGGKWSPTIDDNMKHVGKGLELTEQEKKDIIAFMKTLSDTSFINNPQLQSPF